MPAPVDLITYKGKRQNLMQWCRELDLPHGTIWNRLNVYGWSVTKAFTTPVSAHKTHGMSKTAIYSVFRAMLSRCYNKNNKRYLDWGGRGIYVCKRWREGEGDKSGFLCFLQDMGLPKPKIIRAKSYLEIDRIDNDDGYYKDNCKWQTSKKNSNNRRSNINITYKNRTQTLTEWTEELKLPYATIRARIVKLKWPVKTAFTTPIGKNKVKW